MPKQAYLSMSDVFWNTHPDPTFDKFKVGYVGDIRDGLRYKVIGGIPRDAKLKMVIYVYEDESLPDVPDVDLFKQPSQIIATETLSEGG